MLAILLWAVPLCAEMWFVYQKVEESGSGLNWNQAKKTISEAVNISMPGDTILLGYPSNAIIIYPVQQSIVIHHPLKIWSTRYDEDLQFGLIQPDSSLCFLDALGNSRILLINPKNDTVKITSFNTQIVGLTLMNGDATQESRFPGCGGAICITRKASLAINQCVILENCASHSVTLSGYGGGVCCIGDSTSGLFRSTSILNNTASRFSDGFGGGIAAMDSASVNMHLSCIRQNTASLKAEGYGGGIYTAKEARLDIHHCMIDSNLACDSSSVLPGFGGGICCYGNGIESVIDNNILSFNIGSQVSQGFGGGLAMLDGAAGNIQYNEIHHNTATASMSEIGEGGGIYCSGSKSSPIFAFNTILHNTASLHSEGRGGGICVANAAKPLIKSCSIDSNSASKNAAVLPGFGGGICAYGDSTFINLLNNGITHNIAAVYAEGSGGGIALLENASGNISGNQIQDNKGSVSQTLAGYGGGICLNGENLDLIISNNIIENNQAAIYNEGYGGGIYIVHGSTPLISDNAILENLASDSSSGFGGGIACGYTGTQPRIQNNQIQMNTSSSSASGFGGGLYVFSGASAVCEQNTFFSNFASRSTIDTGQGGGICLINQTDTNMKVVLNRNQIERNIANETGCGYGGGLACDGKGPKEISVRYNQFINNMGTSGMNLYGLGGAVYLKENTSQMVIRNNHFINNLEDSTLHIEGLGSVFYIHASIPDTSIRNNLLFTEASLAHTSNAALYAACPVTITHNAIYGYPEKYNENITSKFEVNIDPKLDPVTMIPCTSSPLFDAGYDPVLNMDENHSGWFIDIGAYEFTGTRIQKKGYASQTINFEGQVRARIHNAAFHDTIKTVMQVHLHENHPLACFSLPRWYQIECKPDTQGSGMLTVSYTDEECQNLDEHSLRLWHFNIRENLWDGPLFTSRDTIANWIQAPFSTLAGDWIITDANDLNALSINQVQLEARSQSDGLLIIGSVKYSPNIISIMLWRSSDGNNFAELNDSKIMMNPGDTHQKFSYLDTNIDMNQTYFYKIEWSYRNGNSGFSKIITAALQMIPKKSMLLPNYPNPFNQVTQIHFLLSKPEKVTIHIWDANGRLIKILSRKSYPAGECLVTWDGMDAMQKPVNSGLYVYRIKTSTFQKCSKMILIR